MQPLTFELIARALVDTDFLGEIPNGTSHHDLETAARIAIDQAAEAWELDNHQPVGATVADEIRAAAQTALMRHGSKILAASEAAVTDAIQNAINDGHLYSVRDEY